MKVFFLLSFFINITKLKLKINKSLFNDFIKYGILLLASNVLIGLLIGNMEYYIWLLRENILLLAVMLIVMLSYSKIKFEYILIYFIFTMNLLHILQTLSGYRDPMFYSFVDMLLIPGVDRDITIYGPGAIGVVLYDITGIYFNRMNLFFDQPSTYFIMITLLSFVLLFQKRNKFALWFFIVCFIASPTKFGVVMIVLFFPIYFMRNKHNFSNKVQLILLSVGVFTITYLPFLIGLAGNILYNGNVTLDYGSTIESRIYWTWLYGTGYMPWEAMATVRSNETYGVYDGIAAKMPFLFASIIAWVVAPKVRCFSVAMILTVFLSVQYGINMTLIWLFFILSIVLKSFFESSRRSKELIYQ